MADPPRYGAWQDEFKPRDRSPPGSRPSSPSQRWSSSSSPGRGRHSTRSQSPRRWLSPPRRNRSASPAPRGYLSPRRRRSRSPPSYTIETPEHRRRRLLTEKVMSIETYERLLEDPRSPWSKNSTATSMPIPVPLERSENTGDYQQKFEFWLAQMSVSLAALRDDSIREREYRCNYARWRMNMRLQQGAPMTTNQANYSRYQSRSRSQAPAQKSRYEPEHTTGQYVRARSRSPVRDPAPPANGGGAQSYAVSSYKRYKTSKRYNTSRRSFRYDEDKRDDSCCSKCNRTWTDLNRRVQHLEAIISRLDPPPANTINGSSASPYEVYGDPESSEGGASPTSNFIDLTDDIEGNADSRSVEITPTDSEPSHEEPSRDGKPDDPSAQDADGLELKPAPQVALLIAAYDRVNSEVLRKQKEEANMVASLEISVDEARTEEPPSQIHDLRDSLQKAKEERDSAVAAVIAHGCTDKGEELGRDLDKAEASGASSEQDALHEKCAGIAAKLAEKDTELARLKKQLQSLSSLPLSKADDDNALGEKEANELLSKIRLEQASKATLEAERHKMFTRLMKSSRQIQALATKERPSRI